MAMTSFKQLFTEAESEDSFWTQKVIFNFTEELYHLMEDRGMTKADLAKKIGTSPAYITKIFRGNVNFTIDSMVKVARALDGELHIHVSDKDAKIRFEEEEQHLPIILKQIFPTPISNPDSIGWSDEYSAAA